MKSRIAPGSRCEAGWLTHHLHSCREVYVQAVGRICVTSPCVRRCRTRGWMPPPAASRRKGQRPTEGDVSSLLIGTYAFVRITLFRGCPGGYRLAVGVVEQTPPQLPSADNGEELRKSVRPVPLASADPPRWAHRQRGATPWCPATYGRLSAGCRRTSPREDHLWHSHRPRRGEQRRCSGRTVAAGRRGGTGPGSAAAWPGRWCRPGLRRLSWSGFSTRSVRVSCRGASASWAAVMDQQVQHESSLDDVTGEDALQ